MLWRVAAKVAVGAAMAFALTASSVRAQSYYYYYNGQAQRLSVDVTQIAVFDTAKAVPDLRPAGIVADAVRPALFPGMRVADTPPAQRNSDGISSLVASVAATDGVEFASPVFLDSRGDPVVITRHLHVGFHAGVGDDEAAAVLSAASAGAIEFRNWAGLAGVYRVVSPSRNGFEVLATANTLARHPAVKFAEPDMIITGRVGEILPNDPGFPLCWGLHNVGQSSGTNDMDMDCPEAWDITLGDPAIVVVVLDTGVQQDHPDINQVSGFDATGSGGGGGPINECDNHGTSVAGCVSGRINNGLGTVGVASGVRVASARWGISNTPCDGTFTAAHSWLVTALNWAQLSGARVTNSSFTMSVSSTVAAKYEASRNAGVVHVAAVGNDGTDEIGFPASLTSVVAVAAVNRDGQRASFSQYGVGLALSAPGEAIYTTDRTGGPGYSTGDYVSQSGTSFASPYVAGVAGLVLSMNPNLSAPEVEAVLADGATDLGTAGYDFEFGWGLVNASRSLAYVAPFSVEFVPSPPQLVVPDTSNTFDIRVTESAGAPLPGSATLHYSLDGAPYQTLPIQHLRQRDFEMWLPAMPCGGLLNYYLTFESSFGYPVSLPAGAPDQVFTVPIATGTSTAFADDFELDTGWTVTNSPELTDGAWERGVPAGQGDRGDPTLDYDGSGRCFLTDNAPGNSDVDAGATTLTSPPIDLTATGKAILKYVRWLSNNTGPNPNGDPLVVEVSGDGSNWVTVEDTVASSRWIQRQINLSTFVPLSNQVQVRFTVSDYAPWGSYVEAAVDSVAFTRLSCDPLSCVEAAAPQTETPVSGKSRFVSFAGGNPGLQTAVRVRFANLPPPHDVLAGATMWVGEPIEISEHGGSVEIVPGFGTMFVAPLQCDPFYTDWGAYGTVHVYDERIVPGGSYTVQEIDVSCDLAINIGFSGGLQVLTGVWGDLVGAFDAGAGAWTEPDGRVDVASDVVAQLDGFAGAAAGVGKARLDVEPAIPDFLINITDVVSVLDAFEGNVYPFPPVDYACP